MIPLTPEQWLDGVAALALAGVALAVLATRGRDPSALGFSAFALGLAGVYVTRSVFEVDGRFLLPAPVLWASVALIGLGAGLLFVYFPTRLTRDDRPVAAVALGGGVAFGGGLELSFFLEDPAYFMRIGSLSPGESAVYAALFAIGRSLLIAAWFGFPLRARRLGPTDATAARSLAILAVGVFLFYSGGLAYLGAGARGEVHVAFALLVILEFTLVFALWVRATRGHHARLARNVVLTGAAITLVALAIAETAATLAYPAGAAFGALLLGYAVLRGQIDGLDLKVRFAVSKSTVAAVFVAAFFVASEAAQQFFGESTQNAYVGIAAAGALVFAIAPLQRVAERVARAAVPDADAGARGGLDRVSLYRKAVEMAMSDGAVSRDEERKLAEMALDLGLTPVQAFEVREAVEGARVSPPASMEVPRE